MNNEKEELNREETKLEEQKSIEEEEEEMPDISDEFAKNILDKMLMEDFLPSPKIAKELTNKTYEILCKLPNIVELENVKNITIVGDTHGQFHDVAAIFKENGLPTNENPYIFNGDFVDRGKQGTEILLVLFAFKIANPNSIYLNRGNHEIELLNRNYGFMEECISKYSYELYLRIENVFKSLPLAHIINHSIFVVHGGLYRDHKQQVSDLQKLDRFVDPQPGSTIHNMLWSDPMNGFGFRSSNRCENGQTMFFGVDVTENFLNSNNLKLIVRSHQVQMSGYSSIQNSKCMTVFSAPNYMGECGNKGAIIKFSFDEVGELKSQKIVQFDSVQPW